MQESTSRSSCSSAISASRPSGAGALGETARRRDDGSSTRTRVLGKVFRRGLGSGVPRRRPPPPPAVTWRGPELRRRAASRHTTPSMTLDQAYAIIDGRGPDDHIGVPMNVAWWTRRQPRRVLAVERALVQVDLDIARARPIRAQAFDMPTPRARRHGATGESPLFQMDGADRVWSSSLRRFR